MPALATVFLDSAECNYGILLTPIPDDAALAIDIPAFALLEIRFSRGVRPGLAYTRALLGTVRPLVPALEWRSIELCAYQETRAVLFEHCVELSRVELVVAAETADDRVS